MTAAPLPLLDPPMSGLPNRDAVEWRRLGSRLWAGRSGGRPVGTIEHGRRYMVIGLDGEIRGSFRTLEAAQAAPVARGSAEPLQDPRALDTTASTDHPARFGMLGWTTSFAGAVAVGLTVTGVLVPR